MISIVVATDMNGVIGRENKIPWRIRDDLAMLRKLTLNHTVILGRVTYDSMRWYYDRSGRSMPGKTYIVVTRNTAYAPSSASAQTVHSIEEALSLAKELGDEQVFVIGGATIYREMLPLADCVHKTEVKTEVQGDAVFPKLDPQEWREISRDHYKKSGRNEYDFDVVVLERT